MKKINIAKLLKDCPKDMELDCTMYDNLYFDSVDADYYRTINCYTLIDGIKTSITFTMYGTYNNHTGAKCVIFPKGKNTWEGFVPPCKFNDGDVLAEDSCIFIIQKIGDNCTAAKTHCTLYNDGDFDDGSILYFDIDSTKLATEEEKEKLFQAIKDNGYHWNAETKTLEKMIESKEDTDRLVMSGIYFDRENYADEVELHLGNYEIEIRDGKTYAVFKNKKTNTFEKFPKFNDGDILFVKSVYDWIIIYKESENDEDLYKYVAIPDSQYRPYRTYMIYDNNSLCYKGDISKIRLATEEEKAKLFQSIKANGYKWNAETKTLEKLVEPKFKVGDVIQDEDCYKVQITAVNKEDEFYEYSSIIAKGLGAIPFEEQDNWELAPNKFDFTTLKHFDKVLCRQNENCPWIISFFGFYDNEATTYPFICNNGFSYKQCIPYKGNEHLLGTREDCDEYYKTWE